MSSPARQPNAYHPVPVMPTKRRHSVARELVYGLAAGVALSGVIAGCLWWTGRYNPTQFTAYTVQPGDTEWSIAVSHDPNTDPRKVIGWMDKHGATDTLQPGMVIQVPVEGRG